MRTRLTCRMTFFLGQCCLSALLFPLFRLWASLLLLSQVALTTDARGRHGPCRLGAF